MGEDRIIYDGFSFSIFFLISIFVLHVVVPGRLFLGYVKGYDGKPLSYKLNGVGVYLIVIWYCCYYDRSILTILYDDYRVCCLFSFSMGLFFSFVFYVLGPFKPHSICAPKLLNNHPRSTFDQFYFGFELNPRFFIPGIGLDWDVKMFLYLYGAIYLQLIVLANAYHQAQSGLADPAESLLGLPLTNAMLVHVCQFSYWIFEYLWNEDVHTYTYDFMDENAGSFKLVWGCMFFYPWFYSIPSSVILNHSSAQTISDSQLLLAVASFVSGAILSRGANNQKFYFKHSPNEKRYLFGLIPQESINRHGRVLCSGFWGLSRHINYLGEILYALGLALCAPFPFPFQFSLSYLAKGPLAYSYVLYYVLLLFPRERDDDERCAIKYGEDWTEYRRKVPYRIIPFVY